MWSTLSWFEELGNPFTEENENLMAIHTRDIMNDNVAATVKNAHKIGEEQFCLFVKERFIDRSKPVTDPLKKNNLPTFSTPTKKAVSKDQAKVKLLKEDCSLFGWLLVKPVTETWMSFFHMKINLGHHPFQTRDSCEEDKKPTC